MTAPRLLRINTQLVASQVFDSEALIINLGNGMIYTMAGVGAEVWRMIEDGCSLGSISTALANRYSVTAEDALSDLEDLAQEMLDEQLVVEEGESGKSGEPAPIECLEPPAPYYKPTLVKDSEMRDVLALDPPLPRLDATTARPKIE